MSADNWANCPKCVEEATKQWKRDKEKLDESYGKVSAERYLEQVRLFPKSTIYRVTLREDYNVGIDGENFCVNYKGTCVECGFKYNFVHKESIEKDNK